MERFAITLAEAGQTGSMSLDARQQCECILRQISGVQQREFDGTWRSRSLECGAQADLADHLPARTRITALLPESGPLLDAGQIVNEHRFLIAAINALNLADWQFQFRIKKNRRLVVDRSGRVNLSRFDHFSVTVRFRIKSGSAHLEVGEGNIAGFKFNQSGLSQRIGELVSSQRRMKRMVFPDPLPVILQAGEGGILFHEILGHSLEADYVCRGVSPFSPADLGKMIVSQPMNLTTRDPNDPFFAGCQGDDEGEKAATDQLIEDGCLQTFISDLSHSQQLKLAGGGHCRCEDFSRLPQPRTYALYVRPGAFEAGEILQQTRRGILAREFGAATIDFHRDRFSFIIHEAHLVEAGKVTAPLGSVTVSGGIRQTLNQVTMIGNDFRYDRGVSYCLKNGQLVNVRVGQPTIRIDGLSVSQGKND